MLWKINIDLYGIFEIVHCGSLALFRHLDLLILISTNFLRNSAESTQKPLTHLFFLKLLFLAGNTSLIKVSSLGLSINCIKFSFNNSARELSLLASNIALPNIELPPLLLLVPTSLLNCGALTLANPFFSYPFGPLKLTYCSLLLLKSLELMLLFPLCGSKLLEISSTLPVLYTVATTGILSGERGCDDDA